IDLFFDYVDPIAQSFAFSAPTDIVRFSVPLAKKGPAQYPVVMQVRSIVNPGGFPDKNPIDEKRFESADLAEGVNSSNDFVTSDPIYFNTGAYGSLIMITDTCEYRVYTATMGQKDQAGQFLT